LPQSPRVETEYPPNIASAQLQTCAQRTLLPRSILLDDPGRHADDEHMVRHVCGGFTDARLDKHLRKFSPPLWTGLITEIDTSGVVRLGELY